MDFSKLDAVAQYTLPHPANLAIRLDATRVLTGRNVGQSTTLSAAEAGDSLPPPSPPLAGGLPPSPKTGLMLKKNECKHPLWRACKRGGLRKIGWHVLRHTFASHLVMRGAPLKVVQELMGHASISSTQIYTHTNNSKLRAAVRKIEM